MALWHKRISALCAAALAAALFSPAPGRAAEKLVMTFVQGNAVYWDIDVAIEKGFLAAEGFAPEIVAMQSSPGGIQEAVGHSVHFAGGSPEPVIDAYERGATDLGFLAAPVRGVDWTFNVRPEIKAVADLKGKTIGVSAIRGGEAELTRKILAEKGLKRGDYDMLLVGVSPLKLAALERGSIAAAALLQPSGLIAASQGFPTLIDFSEIETYPYPTYAVGRAWAHEGEHGRRVSRALVKAEQWLADPANRAEAVAILRKYAKRDEKLLQQTYDMFFVRHKIMVTDGKVDLAGIGRLLAILEEEGDVKGKPDPGKYMIPASDGGLSF